MIRLPPRPSGFTLVEMLIVIAMLLTFSSLPFLMMQRIDSTRVHLDARISAAEQEERALRVWRADIERAVHISLHNDGRRMELTLPGPEGDQSVTYESGPRNTLVRRATDDLPHEIAQDITDLRFLRRGDTWQIAWTATFTDGFTRLHWPAGGFASPLLAARSTLAPTGGHP